MHVSVNISWEEAGRSADPNKTVRLYVFPREDARLRRLSSCVARDVGHRTKLANHRVAQKSSSSYPSDNPLEVPQ